MTADTYYDSIQDMMYEDAIHSLYNGMPVMPWQREVLAMAPLPEDIVDPFAAQDSDPLQIMGLAYKSLVTWIDEARKANYFTKRFTDLSKLVLKGVNTMGRGLMTLHNRGEDLSRAPMQIGDLISVGSYHLRKSYLGVIQTASSHPEISERLLINQLSWTNMLLRLYKTKEKLAIPNEEVRRKKEELSGRDKAFDIRNAENELNEEVRSKKEELSDGKANASSFLPLHSSFGEITSFDELDALFEPAALSAHRALTSFDKGAGKGGRLSPKEEPSPGPRAQIPGQGAQKPINGIIAPEKPSENNKQETHAGTENKIPEAEPLTENGTQEKQNEDPTPEKSSESNISEKPAKEHSSEKRSEIEITDSEPAKEDDPQEKKPDNETSESQKTEKSNPAAENQEPDLGEHPTETGVEPTEILKENQEPDTGRHPTETESDEPESLYEPQDPPPDLETDSFSGASDPDPGMPPYLAVLKNIMERSGSEDDGALTFTGEEMCFLAADPDFNRIYPAAAEHFRSILEQIDSG